jgi:hypothetical protein
MKRSSRRVRWVLVPLLGWTTSTALAVSDGGVDDPTRKTPIEQGDEPAGRDGEGEEPAGRNGPGAERAAQPDSVLVEVPADFRPSAVGERPMLAPRPGFKADSLFGLSAIASFLLPPEGPALVFDRTDLRLTGPAEWWEVAGAQGGVFTLAPGYRGLTSPISFHAHGPSGTLVTDDGRPLAAGVAPVENANAIAKSALAGAALMRVGASHLYGPGAGGGALLFLPLAQAPDRPYSEITTATGIFGQRHGSVTTASRFGRTGVTFSYEGAGADAWSLFGGYRAERYSGRVDWSRGRVRILASARGGDERLKGYLLSDKRNDDDRDGDLSVEARFGAGITGAVRLQASSVKMSAFGPEGMTRRKYRRRGGELLVRVQRGDSADHGILVGLLDDRDDKLGVDGRVCTLENPAGYALARSAMRAGAWLADVSVRYDRLVTGRDVVAWGGTVSRPLGSRGRIWAHVARTVDRPAYAHRTSDFYTQIDQGIDRPQPGGQPIPDGVVAALGGAAASGWLSAELAVVAERFDRMTAQTPVAYLGPYDCDEPERIELRRENAVGGWGALQLRPVHLGRILGAMAFGASGFASTERDRPGDQLEPSRYAEAHGRLRKTVFSGALRLEGEARLEALGTMRSAFGDRPAQSQWVALANARIGDVLVFYRSENVFGDEFRSSAFDESTGFAPITTRNVTVGLSWVLLD